MHTARQIGRNIAAERTRAGLRQSDLGQAIGKATATISRWEAGEVEPRLSDLRGIALALGVSLADLLPDDDARVSA